MELETLLVAFSAATIAEKVEKREGIINKAGEIYSVFLG